MKIFIRTLRNDRQNTLWINTLQREVLRQRLNSLGFYVLSGIEDSLYVYVIRYSSVYTDLKTLRFIIYKGVLKCLPDYVVRIVQRILKKRIG